MRRISCPERDDWRETAAKVGFDFHTADDERYWDESAYYAFSLEEIEHRIEAPSAEIEAMCLELVDEVIDDEQHLRRMRIPEQLWPLIAASWERDDPSLYGRLDLSFDGSGDAKLLEYNADTPTSLLEAAVFQWIWLEQSIERGVLPNQADQFNAIHDALVEAWGEFDRTHRLYLAAETESDEDAGTLAYLEDTARQAGFATTLLDVTQIGLRDDGHFVDPDNRLISLAFKLYPWEWMFREDFGAHLLRSDTRWIEPPWKAILSNKGVLPLLWEMFPGHPNLLPAYFDSDPKAASLGATYVRKPIYSREGANVALVAAGETLLDHAGPYGDEGFVRQALAPLPAFAGNHPVLGSWIVSGEPCGLSIREDVGPITSNTSRFVPHAIL